MNAGLKMLLQFIPARLSTMRLLRNFGHRVQAAWATLADWIAKDPSLLSLALRFQVHRSFDLESLHAMAGRLPQTGVVPLSGLFR